MKLTRNLICFVLPLAAAFMPQAVNGEKNAKVELIDPFSNWFLTENLDFYVRVTNTGDESMPLAWLGRDNTDLFFEIDSELRRKNESLVDLPRDFLPGIETADKPAGWGLILPPGRAYVLSSADYAEADFAFSECLTRVRVNLLLEKGRWVSSDWVERKILPTPDLSGESLYEFILDPVFGGIPNKVLPLKVVDETWLFSHHTGNPRRVGGRLCRLPDGVTVSSIGFDMDVRRLTIQFDGGEEPVVINTRTGWPVSGSERTVPHLHLWRKLAGRPFTDVYLQILERQQGKRDELDRSRSTVPALSLNDATRSRPLMRKNTGADSEPPARSELASGVNRSQDAAMNAVSPRVWLVALGVLIATGIGVWLKNRAVRR